MPGAPMAAIAGASPRIASLVDEARFNNRRQWLGEKARA
jgi:hypothetical protein